MNHVLFTILWLGVWIDKEKRPVVRITGSHKHSCIFSAISMDNNKQLFRQHDGFNEILFCIS
jgi:hypothetical protein